MRVERPVDTEYSPYEWQTVASRITWGMGNAIINAARDAKRQVLELVAQAWNEGSDDLEIVNGVVVSHKSEREMPLKNIGVYGLLNPNTDEWLGGPVVGRGSFMPSYVTGLDKETGQGKQAVVHYTTGAQAFEVEVDMETGRLEIIQAAAAFDVGRAINPEIVKTQMEGGLIQGISSALFEQMKFKDGVMLNPSFVDYRIATAVDLPQKTQIFIVEVPQDDGPWGARGVGEHPMVPSVPGIANAIYDAIGIRLEGPPFTSERLYLAMLDAGVIKKDKA